MSNRGMGIPMAHNRIHPILPLSDPRFFVIFIMRLLVSGQHRPDGETMPPSSRSCHGVNPYNTYGVNPELAESPLTQLYPGCSR
jgi:hypothetical protein